MSRHLCDSCIYNDDCGIRDRIMDLEDDTGVKLQVGFCLEYEPDEDELESDHYDDME